MIIEKYIRQLLFQHDCVVIPDFGGFIAKYAAATVHPARHTFLPPSKEIAFNEMLRINDGLLISHVSVGEKISREQATKLVKDFTDYVRGQIWQSKKYLFEEIGTLSLNPEQKMEFEPIHQINYLNDGFGLPEMSFKPIERNTYQTKVRTKDRQPIPHGADESTDSTLVRSALRHNRTLWYALGFSSLVVLSAFSGYFFLTHSSQQLADFSPLASILKVEKAKKEDKPAQQPEQSTVRSEFVETPQKTAETQASDDWDAIEEEPVKTTEEKIVDAKSEAPKKEEVKTQPKIENTVVKETKTAEPVAAVKKAEKAARYYVIINGFSVEGNAKRFRNNLVTNGHKDAKILERGANGLIKVSYADFANRTEAELQAKQLKKDYPAAWVFENE